MSRVQSIERAFSVLRALSSGPLGVTEVAERVALPKSTVARLLASLVRQGVVEQVEGGTDYRIGPGLVELAGGPLAAPTLTAAAHPELVALAQLSGETAGVALLDGDTVHYVDQVETPNPVRVRDWTGTRAPLWAVPSGLVLMAGMAAPALERILALPLERLTERTVVEPVAIRARLKTIARDGHAWGREEYVEGITSVAAAVADGRGELVGALHIHGPSYRFPPPGAEDEIAAALTAAAARVSGRLRTGARKGGSGSTGPGSRARAVAGPASLGPVSRQA